MQAIPTKYSDVQFRSRLEARWAIFFDLLGWNWEYEPFDLPGWIPDFVIRGHEGEMILVEVKPTLVFPEDVATEIDRAWPVEMSEDGNPYCGGEVLIVGCSLLKEPSFDDLCLGWLRECGCWDTAPLGRIKKEDGGNGLIGFCHMSFSYRDRITGVHPGSCPFGCGDDIDREVVKLWKKAGNLCQWNARLARR
jgi:hypothetical protein